MDYMPIQHSGLACLTQVLQHAAATHCNTLQHTLREWITCQSNAADQAAAARCNVGRMYIYVYICIYVYIPVDVCVYR